MLDCDWSSDVCSSDLSDSDELALQAETALGGAAVADPGFQQALIQVALNTQANAGGSATNTMFFNDSGVEMRSLLLREIGVSGGFTLPILPMLSSVRVGANIKEVIGETFVKRIELRDIQDGRDIWEDILTEFKGSRRRTNRFNVDLGVSVAPIPWLTVGLSARNLLPMEFDFQEPALVEKYRTHTQYKAGAGVSLGGIFRAEIDADLRKLGLDQLRDVRSQLVSAGAELNLFTILKIRAGVYGDLAMKSPKTVVTLGVGISLFGYVKVDVFGQIAATRDQIEQASQFNGSGSDFIPSRAGAGATAGVNLKF
jgi:hypothetical protein